MNFLAHARLSFGVPEILAGNLISDFVKGKKKFEFANGIQKGITLHRNIDAFTDQHHATKEAKKYFRDAYGLYAGAFIDIVYDHFLANDPKEFSDEAALSAFSHHSYEQLDEYKPVFPERFAIIFEHMRRQDWLYHYRFKEGIYNSFAGLVRRSAYLDDHREAFNIFERNYEALRLAYEEFFPQLKTEAKNILDELLNSP